PAIAAWNTRACVEADRKARMDDGEAVAWMTHHVEPMIFPTRDEAATHCADDEQPIPLYTRPAPDDVARLVEVAEFLDGRGSLDGRHFGQTDGASGPYWWRKHLREAIAPFTVAQQESRAND